MFKHEVHEDETLTAAVAIAQYNDGVGVFDIIWIRSPILVRL